jgi:Flp pilus assembly protein TadG
MKQHAQRGGALVEFAIIAPLMLMLFFAAINFGLFMYYYHATNYAARLGARYAAVRGNGCLNTAVCPTSPGAIQSYLLAQVPGLSSGATVQTFWAVPDANTYSGLTGIPTTCDQNDQYPKCLVTVQVTNPSPLNIPFVTNGSTGTITIVSSATQLVVGN